MTATYNDVLQDIIKIAGAALCADLDDAKRKALGDILNGIISVIPWDGAALAPSVQGVTRPVASDAPQGINTFLTVAPGVTLVRFAGKDEIKFLARRVGRDGNPNTLFEISVDKAERVACVYRDARLLVEVKGVTVNYAMVASMAVSALHRWFGNQRKHNSKRRRAAKAKEVAQ